MRFVSLQGTVCVPRSSGRGKAHARLHLSPTVWCAGFLAVLFFGVVLSAQIPTIRGTLSNFDAWNFTGWPAVDLELEGFPHWALLDYYKGRASWGLHPRMHYLSRNPDRPVIEIDWTDPFRPIPHCERRHFGVRLDPAARPAQVRAWWSKKVERIPIPWQNWESTDQGVIDIISLPEDAPGAVTLTRQFAVIPLAVKLQDLRFDVHEITLPDGTTLPIEWQDAPEDPTTLGPGETTELTIPRQPGMAQAAVLVRYPVILEGRNTPDLHFINEALLGPPEKQNPPPIVGTLSNFDVHNFTSHPVEDMELHLMCLEPTDIVKIFPSPWGMPARINAIPGGTEIMWADPDNPWEPSKTIHFGVRLREGVPGPRRVYGWFTRKIELPVPWQTWQLPAAPEVIVDVIRLASGTPGPVEISRQFATLPMPVPLNELNWELNAPWQPVPRDPVVLQPGESTEIGIPLAHPQAEEAAVLVRYTVKALEGWGSENPAKQDEFVTRFVNEAIVSVTAAAAPSVVGSLSNFDVHNRTGGPVHDLELRLEGVRKRDVAGWYTGRGAWGIQPGEHRLKDGHWEIVWKDPSRPIPPSGARHFGVRLNPAWPPADPTQPPPDIYAWWSIKALPIPLPWQWWNPVPGGVVDIIRYPSLPEGEPPGELPKIFIRRDMAILKEPVPLDSLLYDLEVPWRPIEKFYEEFPADSFFDVFVDLEVPSGEEAAVLLRYDILFDTPEGLPQVRVINEVTLVSNGPNLPPRITGTLSNFDVHNWNRQYQFGDLELDMWDIDPYEVLDWYRGPLGWGNPPRIDQIPRGTEVMWADPWNPVPYCKTPHFGLRLLPEAVPSRVIAAWSLKVPIPVPWQWWRAEDNRVVDVIGLGRRYPGPAPVKITRWIVKLADPIPLQQLNWDDTANLPWQPVAGDPVSISPGNVLELPIPVGQGTGAVLVRYMVLDPAGALIARFVNEAEIEVAAVPAPKIRVCDLEGCDIVLRWQNAAEYDTVIVSRDGTVIAVLPGPHLAGDVEEFRDSAEAAGPGWHTYCIQGTLGGTSSTPACCRVEVPPVVPPQQLQCFIEDCHVVLTWKDGSDYEKKRVEMDGSVILELPGPHPAGEIEEVKLAIPSDVPPGGHTFCVTGVWCGIESEPACCELPVPVPQPPRGIECWIEDCDIRLSFVNGSAYEEKIILRDGVEIARIPGPHAAGDTESFTDPNAVEVLGPGLHTYCVVGVWCGLESEPVCCEIEILKPDPPKDIECGTNGCDVLLSFTNGSAYEEKIILRDGVEIARIPGPHAAGDTESFTDPGVAKVLGPGLYTYCVVGVWCGIESNRECCEIEITPPAPPTDIECWIEDCKINVEWTNGADYDEKVITRDGVEIARLPGPHPAGKREKFIDPTPVAELGPALYTYCVSGTRCGMASAETCCEVEVVPPEPPQIRQCRSQGGCKVELTFVNRADYEEKRIYDENNVLIRTIPGPHVAGATETEIVEVTEYGSHSFCVTGVLCGLESEPACCEVEVPFAHCPKFIRGDVNADGKRDIADAISLLAHLFANGAPPPCADAADANDEGQINIADAITILVHLFAAEGPLPEPSEGCGPDPTEDELGCVSYLPCE